MEATTSESARRAQSPQGPAQEESKYILFGLAGETYGIPILQAQEIIADFELTVLPYLPEFFDGVISLRGEAVPVINLRKRFGAADGGGEAPKIIIVEMDPAPVGVLIDQVKKVYSIDNEKIEDPPSFTNDEKAKFITGVAELDKKKFAILLDMKQILTTKEKVELSKTREYLEAKITEPSSGEVDNASSSEIGAFSTEPPGAEKKTDRKRSKAKASDIGDETPETQD